MGACLAANNSRLPKSDELPQNDENLRTQIEGALKETTLAKNIPSKEEFSFQQQPQFKQKSSKKTQNNISEMSVKNVEGSKTALKKDRKTSGNQLVVSKKKVKKLSFKENSESTIKQSTEKQCESQCKVSVSSEQSSVEPEENMPETPHTRKHLTIEPNMLGMGFTENDNKMISLTMAFQTPMRLNEIKFKNMATYSGQWLQGKRHGQGTLRWADGSVYTGKWQNNYSQGQGQLKYAEGGIYQGQFVENRAHGKGVFVYTNGSQYEGEWRDDEPEGMGIMTWQDGQKYVGMWVSGKKHGEGQMFFRDGSFYRGDFNSNQIHGVGLYHWNKEKQYNGEWQHNQMSGKGKLKWQNGQIYEGQFQNGKYHGYGKMKYPDGSTAQGFWQKGRKHGMFDETDPNGQQVQVEWYIGKRAKPLMQLKRRLARRMKTQEENSSYTQQF